MKILLVPILLILLWFLACSNATHSSVREANNLNATEGSFILEVITTASGATYPKEGDILHIRLFADGKFEYDYFPDYNPPKAMGRNVKILRKETRLDEADVNELVRLAESPTFLAAKDHYPSFTQHLDDEWVTKLRFERGNFKKSVCVVNFWDTQYSPELKKNYPDNLIQLLEQVEQMKGKATGRRSHQWLDKPVSK